MTVRGEGAVGVLELHAVLFVLFGGLALTAELLEGGELVGGHDYPLFREAGRDEPLTRDYVSEMVIAPEAKLRVIPDEATACAVVKAPAAKMFPPASVETSAKNIAVRFVAPVLQPPPEEAAKLHGPPLVVSIEGEAAVAIGKLAWRLTG